MSLYTFSRDASSYIPSAVYRYNRRPARWFLTRILLVVDHLGGLGKALDIIINAIKIVPLRVAT